MIIDINSAIDPADENDNTPAKVIKVASLAELLAYQFPPRIPILAPVFVLGSLNMIFSARGVGKTHAALGIAYAAASGSHFWNWKADRPVKTLYIDGEMPGESMQTRIAEIVKSSEKAPPDGFLYFITIDMNDGRMPDLSCLGGQLEVEAACAEAELIVVDNLSCLCRSGKENEAESWLSIAEWAMRMRSLGKCVIFIHHAGKNGNQRGTSKREDILDVVIELKRPSDYDSSQGARFVVNYSKARHLTGNDAASFEAMLMNISGNQTWAIKMVEDSTIDQVIELTNLGLSQTEIANELGINKSNVSRALKKAKDDGLIRESASKSKKKPTPKRVDLDE
ncbi:AAA family ATPase [Methylocucumis oryzae]|uniref:AAA family ATPase n=1 Tax=Methylocucumis oryzae TaxID=1632867 RepID=UPI0006962692|nr:AAA family ATPase [Methylocucumis oryzae]